MTTLSLIFNDTGTHLSLLIVCFVSGCALQPKASQPSVHGTWKGRAELVQITDDKGVTHDALELDILEGQEWPGGKPGRSPLLIQRDQTVVASEALAGRILTVSGTMGICAAYTPVPHRSGARIAAARVVDGGRPIMEFTIRLDREPMVEN
jgi:hypothetical protein